MPRKANHDRDRYSDPFPSRLRSLMEERGEKEKEIASILGLASVQPARNYASGKTAPSSDQVVILAQHFGVSADYLLGLSDFRSTTVKDEDVLRYTGLSRRALDAILMAKNEGSLDVMAFFLMDRSLTKAAVNLRDSMKAAMDAERQNCSPNVLAEKKELVDLHVFRLMKCIEASSTSLSKILTLKDVVGQLERKRRQESAG